MVHHTAGAFVRREMVRGSGLHICCSAAAAAVPYAPPLAPGAPALDVTPPRTQVRVAKASAALEGRDDVSPEDVQKAIKLVILPRSDLSQMNQPVRTGSVGIKGNCTHMDTRTSL